MSAVTGGALKKLPAASAIKKLDDEVPTPATHAELATQHVTNSGDTVLGLFPGYIDKATSRGASYFDVGDEWSRVVARGDDPWTLNQTFLNDRIAAGDRFLLSVSKQDIRPGSYLEQEIQYLHDNN